METSVLQRIRLLVSLRHALLNLPVRLPVGSETFLQVESTLPPFPCFPYGMDFSLAPVLEAVFVFLEFI